MDTNVLLAALSLLGATNIFFIRRLVDKIDNIELSFSSNIPKLQEKMDNLEKQLLIYSEEVREIANIKKDVAVLIEKIKHIEKEN